MGTLPLISVIMPIHNGAGSLERAAGSVLRQTLGDLELLIIDDGSVDQTPQLCEELAERDARVRVWHQACAGVSAARNAGLDQARGRYISFVDDDDVLSPEHLQKLCRALQEDPQAELAVCGYVMEGPDGNAVPAAVPGQVRSLGQADGFFAALGMDGFRGYVWNKLFVREIIERHHLRFDPRISYCEDMLFCCAYITRIPRICCTGDLTYHYHVGTDGTAARSQPQKEVTALLACRRILRMAGRYEDERRQRVLSDYANLLFSEWLHEENYRCLCRLWEPQQIRREISRRRRYLTARNRSVWRIVCALPATEPMFRRLAGRVRQRAGRERRGSHRRSRR